MASGSQWSKVWLIGNGTGDEPIVNRGYIDSTLNYATHGMTNSLIPIGYLQNAENIYFEDPISIRSRPQLATFYNGGGASFSSQDLFVVPTDGVHQHILQTYINASSVYKTTQHYANPSWTTADRHASLAAQNPIVVVDSVLGTSVVAKLTNATTYATTKHLINSTGGSAAGTWTVSALHANSGSGNGWFHAWAAGRLFTQARGNEVYFSEPNSDLTAAGSWRSDSYFYVGANSLSYGQEQLITGMATFDDYVYIYTPKALYRVYAPQPQIVEYLGQISGPLTQDSDIQYKRYFVQKDRTVWFTSVDGIYEHTPPNPPQLITQDSQYPIIQKRFENQISSNSYNYKLSLDTVHNLLFVRNPLNGTLVYDIDRRLWHQWLIGSTSMSILHYAFWKPRTDTSSTYELMMIDSSINNIIQYSTWTGAATDSITGTSYSSQKRIHLAPIESTPQYLAVKNIYIKTNAAGSVTIKVYDQTTLKETRTVTVNASFEALANFNVRISRGRHISIRLEWTDALGVQECYANVRALNFNRDRRL